MLCQGEVFVGAEWGAQLSEVAGRVARREARIGEGRCREDRQSFVVVVVIHAQWNPRIEAGAVEPVQQRIAAAAEDGDGSSACILESATHLPAAPEVLSEIAAAVQKRLSRAKRQLVYECQVDHLGLIGGRNRPFGL